MKRILVSPERIERILILYRFSDLTLAEIADEMGVSTACVTYHARKHGFRRRVQAEPSYLLPVFDMRLVGRPSEI